MLILHNSKKQLKYARKYWNENKKMENKIIAEQVVKENFPKGDYSIKINGIDLRLEIEGAIMKALKLQGFLFLKKLENFEDELRDNHFIITEEMLEKFKKKIQNSGSKPLSEPPKGERR